MIKMTEKLFEKFSTKQEELDSMIRMKHNISIDDWNHKYDVNHLIALQVEVAEFVNECFDLWKYWKQKAVRPDDIIGEMVDVIHFLHLMLNKQNHTVKYHVDKINAGIPTDNQIEYITDELGEARKASFLLLAEGLHTIYAYLLVLADHYGFTLEDIERAYDEKNKINHDRQARDY